jgi:DNA-binding transcriptional LysR family regulator
MTDHYVCLVRKGHPVLKSKNGMNVENFTKYQHIQIFPRDFSMCGAPIDAALAKVNASRRIGVWLPNFLVLPYVISTTDMIGVVFSKLVEGIPRELTLVTVDLPIQMPATPFSMYWHPRSARDEGLRWLRKIVAKALRDDNARAKSSRREP